MPTGRPTIRPLARFGKLAVVIALAAGPACTCPLQSGPTTQPTPQAALGTGQGDGTAGVTSPDTGSPGTGATPAGASVGEGASPATGQPAKAAPAARMPAVPASDPSFARVEGTSFKNACAADADCKVGGCSGEVCSAEEGVMTSCETFSGPQAGAACGCVSGQCAWYR